MQKVAAGLAGAALCAWVVVSVHSSAWPAALWLSLCAAVAQAMTAWRARYAQQELDRVLAKMSSLEAKLDMNTAQLSLHAQRQAQNAQSFAPRIR